MIDRRLFNAGGAVFALLAFLAPKSLVITMPLIGLAGLVFFRAKLRDSCRSWLAGSLWLWVLVGLGLFSALWSIDPGASFSRALRLLGEVFGGLAFVFTVLSLSLHQRASAVFGFAGGMIVALALVFLDKMLFGVLSEPFRSGSPLLVFISRAEVLTAILILALPLALHRRGHNLPAAFVILLGVALLLNFEHQASQVALGLGLASGFLAYLWRGYRWVLAAAGAVVILAMPLLVNGVIKTELACSQFSQSISVVHRMSIWSFATERTLERPIAGWGLDSVRRLPGGNDLITDVPCSGNPDHRDWSDILTRQPRITLHAHNFAVQIWAELGLLGAAVAALIWAQAIGVGYRYSADQPLRRAAVAGVGTAAFTVAGLSFGIWQGWWLASLFLFAAMVGVVLRDESAQ